MLQSATLQFSTLLHEQNFSSERWWDFKLWFWLESQWPPVNADTTGVDAEGAAWNSTAKSSWTCRILGPTTSTVMETWLNWLQWKSSFCYVCTVWNKYCKLTVVTALFPSGFPFGTFLSIWFPLKVHSLSIQYNNLLKKSCCGWKVSILLVKDVNMRRSTPH